MEWSATDQATIAVAQYGSVIGYGPQPPSATTVKALIDNFASLPEMNQQKLLTEDWPKLASPSIEPLLIGIAKGRSPAADTTRRDPSR